MEGLPVHDVDTLLASQSQLLEKIRPHYNTSDPEVKRLFDQAIRNYASIVHLLPASETDHHAMPGGLLRHGLEVALYAMSVSNTYTPFARTEVAERRKLLELRWRYAILVSALCHDIGKPVTDLNVTDASGNHRWNPFAASIPEWARRVGISEYFIHWKQGRHKRHEPASLTLLSEVMGQEGKDFLTEIPSELFSDILESVSGNAGALNITAKLVKEGDAKSTSHDKAQAVTSYGNSGIPVDRYYVSAIRRLVKEKAWKPNVAGSPFWVIQDQAYLVWPAAGKAIAKSLQKDDVRGIPMDEETIARELLDRSLAVPFVHDDNTKSPNWPILPDALKGSGVRAPLLALRLASLDLVSGEVIPSAQGLVGAQAKAFFEPQKESEGQVDSAAPGEAASSLTGEGAHQDNPESPAKAEGKTEKAEQKTEESTQNDASAGDPAAPAPAQAIEQPPVKPDAAGSRVLHPEQVAPTVDGEQVAAFFGEDAGFINQILKAFGDDLNHRKTASNDVRLVEYRPKEGDDTFRIVSLAVPGFFAGMFDDLQIIQEESERADIFLKNEGGSLDFLNEETGEIEWRLGHLASQCLVRQAHKYFQSLEKGKIKSGANAAKAPAEKPTESTKKNNPGPTVEKEQKSPVKNSADPGVKDKPKKAKQAPQEAEQKKEQKTEAKKIQGAGGPSLLVRGRKTKKDSSDGDHLAEDKRIVRDRIVEVLRERWEVGVKSIDENELIAISEKLSEGTKIKITPPMLKTLLQGVNVDRLNDVSAGSVMYKLKGVPALKKKRF
nr:MobH family relaxase [Ectothiorhodospira haloalkaliphila]